MKNFLFRLLGNELQHDKYLKKEAQIDPKVCPKALIVELRKGELQSFIDKINAPEAIPLLALRKLSLVHYLLIHHPEFSQSFQEVNLKVQTNDVWLNDNVLKPYSVFLYKIINAGQMYGQSKFRGVLQISFPMLFYVINTLYDLFPCIRKMSSLHRYYEKAERDLITTATIDFIMVNAFEAQDLYHCFKAILGEMMQRPQIYLKSESDEKMIKYILDDVVFKLNEEMKTLFLDKYYFPYGKGLGVKLVRPDELTGASRQFLDSVAMKEYEELRRKPKKKKTLNKLLFDQSGHLNPEIYATLTNIRHTDQSFRSSPNLPRNATTAGSLKRHDDYEMTQDI